MNKFVFGAIALMAAMSFGTHSAANRIAACEQKGGPEAACMASEWDFEKVNTLPKFNPEEATLMPATTSLYVAPVARG